MASDAATGFHTFLRNAHFIAAGFGTVGGPLVPPIAVFVAGSPFWPGSASTVTAIWTLGVYVIEGVIYISVFHRLKDRAKGNLIRLLVGGCMASAVLLVVFVFFMYCFLNPLEGWGYSQKAAGHMARHPDYTVWQLLAAFGNDE